MSNPIHGRDFEAAVVMSDFVCTVINKIKCIVKKRETKCKGDIMKGVNAHPSSCQLREMRP